MDTGDVRPKGRINRLTLLNVGPRHLLEASDRVCYRQGFHITLTA
jgi:hypothetical protein